MMRMIVALALLCVFGSRLSNVNTEACSAGDLSCGTAIWMLLMIAVCVGVAAVGLMKLLAAPPRRLDADDE